MPNGAEKVTQNPLNFNLPASSSLPENNMSTINPTREILGLFDRTDNERSFCGVVINFKTSRSCKSIGDWVACCLCMYNSNSNVINDL